MASSLFSALSGMRVHQQWINVIGNNLANSNTPGFKSSRAIFADGLTQTLRAASSPAGGAGGRNPVQIGMGVLTAAVGRDLEQGALTITGRVFDLAIEGRGFFALADGAQRLYTRVGTFGLDGSGQLVDQRTGFNVLNAQGNSIGLDLDGLLPPNATSAIELAGNLPAEVTGPLAEVLTGSTALREGAPAMVTGSVAGPSYAVPAGSTSTMSVVVSGSVPQTVSVTDSDSDGFLLGTDVAAAIDALDGVSSAVNGGLIEVTSDRTGAQVSLEVVPAAGPNDLASLIGMPTIKVMGSESDVTVTTDLNTLPFNVNDYAVGDMIDISGVDTDGSPISATFEYGVDGTTVNELVNFIDGLYTDAQVSLNASGQILVEAQTPGESDLLLSIRDDEAALGSTQWNAYGVAITTDGTGPDTVTTSSEVYDSQGLAHTLTFTFERQPDSTWTLTTEVPADEGQIVNFQPIDGITFDDDGSPTGLGLVDPVISVLFDGQSSAQDMVLDFGEDGGFDGLTQFGGQATAFARFQDGYAPGELSGMSVNTVGTIEGFYTNGQTVDIGSVGVAVFTNPEGLAEIGAGLWTPTGNSGAANLGEGGSQVASKVVGGSLENSNVDTAEQFVRLIEAQRGFQANARVISTQDEVLAEVVNLI